MNKGEYLIIGILFLYYFFCILFNFQGIDIGMVPPITFESGFHVCMLFSNH